MIAEFFYPRRLKKMIRHLKSENNFRQEPLRQFNRELRAMFLILFLIVSIFLLNDGFFDLDEMLTLIFMFSAYYLFLYIKIRKFEAYVYGGKYPAKIIHRPYFFQNRALECCWLSNNKKTSVWLGCLLSEDQKYGIGKIIDLYSIGQGRYFGMPDIEGVKRLYCLRKDLMQEGNGA